MSLFQKNVTRLESTGSMRQVQTEALYVEWNLPNPRNENCNQWKKSPTFQFSDCFWHLRTYRQSDGWIRFNLTMENSSQESKIIYFVLGIKKTDGTIFENSAMLGRFDETNSSRGYDTFTKYDAEGMPSNNWSLTCRMIRDRPLDTTPRPLLLKNYATLSTNLKELLVSKNNSDVTIKVKEHEFQAHKAILGARSPVLAAAFQHDMSEKQTGVITIEDCCPDSFKYFLDYLYTGTIEGYSWRNVYHLYIIADKYNEQDLKSFCLSHLMSNLTVDNVCDVFRLAEQYEETDLTSSAQFFFCQNVNKITATCDWEKLMADDTHLALKILKHAACNNENTIHELRDALKQQPDMSSGFSFGCRS